MLSALLIASAWAGTLTGVVRERGTGDPIGGAILEVDGQPFVVEPDGRFSVAAPDGLVSVRVYAAGFDPALLEVQVPLSEPLRVFLEPGEPPMEVVVESRREVPHVSAQILDRERVEKVPGTYGDPIRLIQSLPGVAATPEFSPNAGDIAVRGADPSETRVFLDGVEVPYLFHFQQYASVFHTRLLDEMAFYPSTFGAPYGDATGAIVWTQSRQPDTERLHGGIDWSTIMAGGYITAPVGPGVVSASARRSYADLRESESDQYTLWPVFWDYLARYDQDLGSTQHHAALTVFGAGDHYGRYVGDTALLDPLEQEANPELAFNRSFHAVSLRLSDSFERLELRTSLALVHDDWRAELAAESSQRRREDYGWLRNDAMFTLGERRRLATGLELKVNALVRQTDSQRFVPEIADEAPLIAFGAPVDERMVGVHAATWIEPAIELGPATLRPGLRVQADSLSQNLLFDPRLSARVPLGEVLTLEAAAGRYSQAPSGDALSPVTGDPGLEAGWSDSAQLGVEFVIQERWEVGVEGWGKQLTNVVVERPGEPAEAVNGTAWGVEFTSRYRMRERFFSWASLTIGHAERGGVPFDYDQPFAVALVGSWDINTRWNAGLRYRYAKGLPYTPIEGGVYNGDADRYDPVLGDTNAARLPDVQKLDAHLEYSFPLRTWTLVAYLEAGYVPKANNGMYTVYSYDYSQQALVAGPGFLPLVGLRADL